MKSEKDSEFPKSELETLDFQKARFFLKVKIEIGPVRGRPDPSLSNINFPCPQVLRLAGFAFRRFHGEAHRKKSFV